MSDCKPSCWAAAASGAPRRSTTRCCGVTDVESGYSNGETAQPSYEQVCTGRTGHNEVVKLTYDPAQVSTRQILEIFFVDPRPDQLNRQGNDVGTQYRSGIYYTTPSRSRWPRT